MCPAAALRRDTDVKWISQIRTGECGWQLKRYHCHVWRRYSQGESISPSLGLSTFFYVLIHHIAACKFERLVYLNTYRLTDFHGLSAECINAYHISSRSSVAVNRWHNERWLMIWYPIIVVIYLFSSGRGYDILIQSLVLLFLYLGYIHPPSILTYGPFLRRGGGSLFYRGSLIAFDINRQSATPSPYWLSRFIGGVYSTLPYIVSYSSVAVNQWHNERWPMIWFHIVERMFYDVVLVFVFHIDERLIHWCISIWIWFSRHWRW